VLEGDLVQVLDVVRLGRDRVGALGVLVKELTFAAFYRAVTAVLQVVALP